MVRFTNLTALVLIESEMLFGKSYIESTSILNYFSKSSFNNLPWYECREDFFASDLMRLLILELIIDFMLSI